MSVFRNIVVVGVIGVVLSDAGQGFSAPLPIHFQNNAPENSILDLEGVKGQSIEVKETQGEKSDINSLEKVPQLKPKGSLLKRLKSNSSGTKLPSKRHSEANINKELPESKPNQDIISALKQLKNIYKNQGSLLAELKSSRKGENISPSASQFQQDINDSFAANNNQKSNLDSENVATQGKSNSSLLKLLDSNSGNSEVETNINPPAETSLEQSTIFLNKEPEKSKLNSENVATQGKSNSSLLELLDSKSGNSEVETEINPLAEIGLEQSTIFLNKEPEKFNLNSENVVAQGQYDSSLLELLNSKSKTEKSQIETAKIYTSLKASIPESQNQQKETNNLKKTSEINPIRGNSYQIMTSINRAPAMATINDLSEIETQASALNNSQKRNNYPIRLPGRTNQSLVSTIQGSLTFGNTSKQQDSVQIMTGLNPTSSTETVPNLVRVENQKKSSNNSSLIIAQQNSESFPLPVPNGTLQTNPPPQIEPNSNPLYFPITPDQVQIKETIPITLEEAIDLARRNNPGIQVSQLEVEKSKASLREAQATLWPSLTFDSVIQRTESAFGDLQAQAQQRVAEVTGRDQFIDTDIQNFPTTTFTNTFRFDYDLGLGKARSSRIGVAREQMYLRELELERVSEELRLNVSDDYYNLQQADGRVRIGEAAVRNSRKSLEDAEALERAGVGTRFDVLQAQVTLSNEQQNLTNALRDQRTAQRRLAERLSANELINLTAADPIEPVGSWPLSLDETIIAAFQNRAELEQQLVQRDLSDEQRKLALSSVRPSLNFFATYDVLALTTENQSWRAARGWADGSTIGLRFRWNFFDGGAARASARRSILDGEIAETRFEEVRNQIRREVEEAFFSLEASFENISTAELGVEQAKEALRLARLRFQAGVGTQLEVIEQETDLTRAEDNLLRAIIDYNRSLSELQRAVSNFPGGNLSDNP